MKTEKRPRRLSKKFRFQLVHQWLINNYKPCRFADVGGGNGLLTYLLNESGWYGEIIDPEDLPLYWKYKTLEGKRIKIQDRYCVKRRKQSFTEDIVKDFDLIIGLHLHGANMKIIEACAKYQRDFLLLPCCVIDEPIEKQPNINWRKSLIEYAELKGFIVKEVKFNFKGRNIGIYSTNCSATSGPD